jgi:FlaA1/EpsC-like NDP-sugar epimerase
MLFYLLHAGRYYDDYVRSGQYTASPIYTHLGREFWELKDKLFGIIGMVDDDARKRHMESYGVRVLGSTEDIPALVEKYQIGLIFFAITNGSEWDRNRITKLCEATDAKIVVIPDLVKVLERSIKKITTQESS